MNPAREGSSGNPELDALAHQLWPPGDDAEVQLRWHTRRHPAAPVPTGYVEAERYALVPNLRTARFLVPLSSRRAAAASLLRFNGLRDPKTALSRTVLGTIFRWGGRRLFRDQLRILIPESVPRSSRPRHLLVDHLRQELGTADLAAGIGVRPLDPNSKPTLQLFDFRGRPVGYAKIGWNEATRHLVDTEAATLGALPEVPAFATPRVLHTGAWAGRSVVVTSPLPAAVSRHVDPDRPPQPGILAPLLGDAGSTPLQESAYWHRVSAEAAAVEETAELATALTAYVEALRQRRGTHRLRFGRWHGDWVPWNLGWVGPDLHVWDWEHSTGDAPAGFDLAHWHFQVAFVLREKPLPEALKAVHRACAAGWPALGVGAASGPAVAELYLLELALRTSRLQRGGGGWNAGLYPALLPALQEATAGRFGEGTADQETPLLAETSRGYSA